MPASALIEVLAKLVSVHGAPRVLRSDNGPEFVSSAVLRWLVGEQIDCAHIDPGKSWQNGTDESFNGRFREESSTGSFVTNGPPRPPASACSGSAVHCPRVGRVTRS